MPRGSNNEALHGTESSIRQLFRKHPPPLLNPLPAGERRIAVPSGFPLIGARQAHTTHLSAERNRNPLSPAGRGQGEGDMPRGSNNEALHGTENSIHQLSRKHPPLSSILSPQGRGGSSRSSIGIEGHPDFPSSSFSSTFPTAANANVPVTCVAAPSPPPQARFIASPPGGRVPQTVPSGCGYCTFCSE